MRDIKRILCPVDFSDDSRHAIEYALAIARWYGASITALHVYSPVYMPIPALGMTGGEPDAATTVAEVNRLREETAGCFDAAGGLEVQVRVDQGRPPTTILDCAASLPADLIVMGTHGLGGFEHLVLGSVTEKVVRKASCPVLTVPPRARATSTLPFKRLLCPVDFSPSSLEALQFAFSLAEEGDAELTILHVLEWPMDDEPLATRPFSVPEYRQERERDAAASLERLVPESVRVWCRPATRIGHGKPYREILGVATEDSVDVIVMGIHGRNAVDLALFGSTTNQVVRRATCPVLTLRTS